jgi:hypothetical protein
MSAIASIFSFGSSRHIVASGGGSVAAIGSCYGDYVCNGKTYHLHGESVRQEGDKIWINEVLQGEGEKSASDVKVVYRDLVIQITGNVGDVRTSSGTITIKGDVKRATSTSGNVEVQGNVLGDASSTSGDITAQIVYGDMSSMSGDVRATKYNHGSGSSAAQTSASASSTKHA